MVLVTHSNFPHIDWAHNLLEVALKPGSKPPIFRPFGPSSPPKRTGLTAIRGVGGRRPTPTAENIAKRFEHERLTMDPANRKLLWEVSKQETQKWADSKTKASRL